MSFVSFACSKYVIFSFFQQIAVIFCGMLAGQSAVSVRGLL